MGKVTLLGSREEEVSRLGWGSQKNALRYNQNGIPNSICRYASSDLITQRRRMGSIVGVRWAARRPIHQRVERCRLNDLPKRRALLRRRRATPYGNLPQVKKRKETVIRCASERSTKKLNFILLHYYFCCSALSLAAAPLSGRSGKRIVRRA